MKLFQYISPKLKKIIRFIETCAISNPVNDKYVIQQIKLFKHQKEYLKVLHKFKKIILLKSKQIGETITSISYITYIANFKPKSIILIVSTNYTDLQEKRIKLLNFFSSSNLPYRHDYENIIDCGNQSQIMLLTLEDFFNLSAQYNKTQNSENTYIFLLDVDFKIEVISSIIPTIKNLNKANIVITLDNRKIALNNSIFTYINNIAKKEKIKVHYMNQYKITFTKKNDNL